MWKITSIDDAKPGHTKFMGYFSWDDIPKKISSVVALTGASTNGLWLPWACGVCWNAPRGKPRGSFEFVYAVATSKKIQNSLKAGKILGICILEVPSWFHTFLGIFFVGVYVWMLVQPGSTKTNLAAERPSQGQRGQWQLALEFFQQMPSSQLLPDVISDPLDPLDLAILRPTSLLEQQTIWGFPEKTGYP